MGEGTVKTWCTSCSGIHTPENQEKDAQPEKKKREKTFSPTSETRENILRHWLARSQNLGHTQKMQNNGVATTTKLSIARPKTPSKVRVLGARDLCAPQPQRRDHTHNEEQKEASKGKKKQTTTSTPAAETQVCYMTCNATLRRQIKQDGNRTNKEYQQEV